LHVTALPVVGLADKERTNRPSRKVVTVTVSSGSMNGRRTVEVLDER
jgi:hypothetical protein